MFRLVSEFVNVRILYADFRIETFRLVFRFRKGSTYENITNIQKYFFRLKYQNIGFIEADLNG